MEKLLDRMESALSGSDAGALRMKVLRMRYLHGPTSYQGIAESIGISPQVARSCCLGAWKTLLRSDPAFLRDIDAMIKAMAWKKGFIQVSDISATLLGGGFGSIKFLKDYARKSGAFRTVTLHGRNVMIRRVKLQRKPGSGVDSRETTHGDIAAMLRSALIREKNGEILLRRSGLHAESESLKLLGGSYGVTRERIRQVCRSVVANLLKRESGSGPMTTLRVLAEKYAMSITGTCSISRFIESDSRLAGFSGNEKGLYCLLSSSGFRSLLRDGGHFIHPESMSRIEALANLADQKKKDTVAKGIAVKYLQITSALPAGIIQEAKRIASARGITLGSFYSGLILDATDKPSGNYCRIPWSSIGHEYALVCIRMPAENVDLVRKSASENGVSRAVFVANAIMKGVEAIRQEKTRRRKLR